MNKFIPEPWKLDKTSENAWSIYPVEPDLQPGYGEKGKPIIGEVCGFDWRGTRHEAKAKIIAKSPEMLALLKRAYECLVYPQIGRVDTVATFREIQDLLVELDAM